MLAAAASLSACTAPASYRVTSDHFTATFRRPWQVVWERDGDVEALLFEHPTDPIEVRVYAWLLRRPLGNPNAEALGRLWGRPSLALPWHRPTSGSDIACRAGVQRVAIVGSQSPPVDLRSSHWRTVLVSAQAEGSLLAIVARRPAAMAAGCAQLEHMVRVVQGLAANLRAVVHPRAEASSALPGRPDRVPHR
jgi:hypothetical protein